MTAIKQLIEHVSVKDIEERKRNVEALEQIMLNSENRIELNQLRHFWSGDVYCRELFMPAGAVVVGRIHKFDHMEIMLSGKVTLSTNDGSVEELSGYNVFEAQAGKKRVLYMHDDTMWLTFHSAPKADPDYLLDYLSCETYEQFIEFQSQLKALEQESKA